MSNESLPYTDDACKEPPAQINPASLVKTPDLSVKLEHSLDKSNMDFSEEWNHKA